MKAIKDWICCHLASSKSLISARVLSGNFLDEEPGDEELTSQGSTVRSGIPTVALTETSHNIRDSQVNESFMLLQPLGVEDSQLSHFITKIRKSDPLAKVEALQIKFLRLIYRLGLSTQNPVVTQVLHRMQLACLIRAGESDISRAGLKQDKARAIAAKLELAGLSDLDLSFKILLLGKTGVGKSATINSIFDEAKAVTSAFHPATDRIHEVVGFVNGIKVAVVDTPGLMPSCSDHHRNMKTLLSIKKVIERSKPDIVLYFERLDLINAGYSDFPLLKLVTDVLGSAVWFNTVLVMTHAASALPEGPDGCPVSYGGLISRCTTVVQHYIRQAASDLRLENPVLLVENHPMCRTNDRGEKVLPNGQIWRSQFLLMCAATKVLGDVNAILKFQDILPLTQPSIRMPSLPHLLSSFLRPSSGGPSEELDEILDLDEEDEYDKLPPIRLLKKAQFESLSKDQQSDYLDELDYRETLYLKKQLKEELRQHRDNLLSKDETSNNDDNYENNSTQEMVPLPDMSIPLSFDSDNPVHRYRHLVGYNDQWLVRPVLDSQGWDHEVGFDGINLEVSEEIRSNLHASVMGQMSKEKHDFSIQTECSATYKDLKGGPALRATLDIQSSDKNFVSTIRGDTMLQNWKNNTTGCGVSMTSFGNKQYFGAKLVDSLLVGRRLKLVFNAGRLVGDGQVAYGGSVESILRGIDYPMKTEKINLAMTALAFDRETVLGGNVQSDFYLGRNRKASVNFSLNSKKMGQISLKTSSSEHVEFVIVAVYSILTAIFRRKPNENATHSSSMEEIE